MVSVSFGNLALSLPMIFYSLPAELPAGVGPLDRTSAFQRNRYRDAQSTIYDFGLPTAGRSPLRGGAGV